MAESNYNRSPACSAVSNLGRCPFYSCYTFMPLLLCSSPSLVLNLHTWCDFQYTFMSLLWHLFQKYFHDFSFHFHLLQKLTCSVHNVHRLFCADTDIFLSYLCAREWSSGFVMIFQCASSMRHVTSEHIRMSWNCYSCTCLSPYIKYSLKCQFSQYIWYFV